MRRSSFSPLRPLLAEIPQLALAAVTVSAAIVIIDVEGYRRLWEVSREEFVLAGITAVGVLHRIARPHDAGLGDHPDADRFRDRVEQVLSRDPGRQEWLILDFEGVGSLDATALDALVEVVAPAEELKVGVVGVARANDRVIARLTSADLLEPVGPLRTFPTINASVSAYRQRGA